IGNEHFCSVEKIAITVTGRGHRNGLNVTAGLTFREGQPSALLTACEGRKKTPLLLVCSVNLQNVGHDEVGIEDSAQTHPAATDLFDHHGVCAEVQTQAAIFFRND